MKTLDRITIERYGIPGLVLMEHAGRGIADLAEGMLSRNKFLPPLWGKVRMGGKYSHPHLASPIKGEGNRVLVVCGKGNNGGDGFVSARHLANRGFSVQVILLGKPNDLTDDARSNYQIIKKMGIPITYLTSRKKISRLKILLNRSDLIIDGIFGVGLTRPVEGIYRDAISLLNSSRKPILAIDVPSGLDSDRGKILGIAVRAKMTGTLGLRKRGLLLNEGPACSGKVKIIDISIPRQLVSMYTT